jgi:hypothetical protein
LLVVAGVPELGGAASLLLTLGEDAAGGGEPLRGIA